MVRTFCISARRRMFLSFKSLSYKLRAAKRKNLFLTGFQLLLNGSELVIEGRLNRLLLALSRSSFLRRSFIFKARHSRMERSVERSSAQHRKRFKSKSDSAGATNSSRDQTILQTDKRGTNTKIAYHMDME